MSEKRKPHYALADVKAAFADAAIRNVGFGAGVAGFGLVFAGGKGAGRG
jgi:hypothetical protein